MPSYTHGSQITGFTEFDLSLRFSMFLDMWDTEGVSK